jgi:Zn-dependent protease
MLPIPPLDGSRIVAALLPRNLAWQYDRLEPYGFIVLIGLMIMDWLTPLISPIFLIVKTWVLWIAGIDV